MLTPIQRFNDILSTHTHTNAQVKSRVGGIETAFVFMRGKMFKLQIPQELSKDNGNFALLNLNDL